VGSHATDQGPQGHDYEMPPLLSSFLISGIVDVIGLLERHELYDPVCFDEAVCRTAKSVTSGWQFPKYSAGIVGGR
jgi:hypothetical protein